MDDRFDRRELLLHLGDVLNAMRHAAAATRPYAPIAELAAGEPSLQALAFLRHMSPRIRVKDFLERAMEAYANWPTMLLETELDRDALAAAVRHALFEHDPQGWDDYASFIRQKIGWFGANGDVPSADATTPPLEPEPPQSNATDASAMKKGWPWNPIEQI